MKKELLSPAGDFESLKAAVHAGADAIYVGGKKFGARRFASNFDEKNLTEAVQYCHLYGVKLYVTVNTMIYEEEMAEVLHYIAFLYRIHVDAVIVQDIGLICEIRKIYPDMEIHASTQLHNYCQESCNLLEELGVKRVVLARELTLNEIEKISTPLEKEVFIHGAICISYSGQCLFSKVVMNRSGNRGECAGMCRLPYSLENEQGEKVVDSNYLLSPKELCTIPKFLELLQSDIACFKIEGRMKSPSYVYYVTKIYRTLIDHYEKGEEVKITEEEMEKLQVLYNRGFTEGHLFGKENLDLMNIDSPNHIGIVVGKVVAIQNHRIKIHLSKDLHQEDGIRFVANGKGMVVNFLYDKNGLLIRSAKAGDFVWVDNKISLKSCCDVLKTSDRVLLKEFEAYPLKKIPIQMQLKAFLGKPVQLQVSDGETVISLEQGMVLSADKCPITKEDIFSHLNRLGDTPYRLEKCDIFLDKNIFIPIRLLNEIRRIAITRFNDKRCFREKGIPLGKYEAKKELKIQKKCEICCLVRTEEQLISCLRKNVYRIYVTDKNLYEKYAKDYTNLYYRRGRLHFEKTESIPTLSTEFCQLFYSSSITDYYLNVANISYLEYLERKKVDCATLSIELTPANISYLAQQNCTKVSLEVVVYGRIELMIMKYCPLHMLLYKGNGVCHVCRDNYYLVDRNLEKYPIVADSKITHLMSSKKVWFSEEQLSELLRSGIDFFRLEFFDENAEEVTNILEKYQHLLQKHEIYDRMLIERKG